VVAGHREYRRPERPQEVRRPLELLPPPAMGEIAGGDDELGLEALHEPSESAFYFPLLMCTCVQVGNMEEPGVHDRTRL
jgi:hypothetical protein